MTLWTSQAGWVEILPAVSSITLLQRAPFEPPNGDIWGRSTISGLTANPTLPARPQNAATDNPLWIFDGPVSSHWRFAEHPTVQFSIEYLTQVIPGSFAVLLCSRTVFTTLPHDFDPLPFRRGRMRWHAYIQLRSSIMPSHHPTESVSESDVMSMDAADRNSADSDGT